MLLSFEYPEPEIEKRNNFCENTGTETELLSKCYKLRLSFPWNLNLAFSISLKVKTQLRRRRTGLRTGNQKDSWLLSINKTWVIFLLGSCFMQRELCTKQPLIPNTPPSPRDFSNNLQLCLLLRIQPTDQKIPWNSNPETQTFIEQRRGGEGSPKPNNLIYLNLVWSVVRKQPNRSMRLSIMQASNL